MRLEKIGSASAVAQVIQQQADKAQEEGLTREQVWGRCGAGVGQEEGLTREQVWAVIHMMGYAWGDICGFYMWLSDHASRFVFYIKKSIINAKTA